MEKPKCFELPNFLLQCGIELPVAKVVYQTYGELNAAKNNAILYPTSYGAQQGYHWGALYPERVQRIAALCGTAKTTDHNKVFLYSLRAALQGDPTWNGERFEGTPDKDLHTFTQIYANWAASQAYYRAKHYLEWGYTSLEDYLLRSWEASYRKRDPHNLLGDDRDLTAVRCG